MGRSRRPVVDLEHATRFGGEAPRRLGGLRLVPPAQDHGLLVDFVRPMDALPVRDPGARGEPRPARPLGYTPFRGGAPRMIVRVRIDGELVELRSARSAAPGDAERLRLPRPPSAADLRELRRLLHSEGGRDVCERSDAEVLRDVRRRLSDGRLAVAAAAAIARPGEARRGRGVGGGAVDGSPPDAFRGPEARPLHAVAIELVGEDDEPIAGERYRIQLPDGTVREGATDHRGQARVDGVQDPGTCVVSFPRLDAEAWTFVTSTPL